METPVSHNIQKICDLLAKKYPRTSLGNKKNPLDEYLYIILSLRTHQNGFERSYKAFKKRFPSWDNAYLARKKEIEKTIMHGGLADQKAQRIKMALKFIKNKLGEVSLNKLKYMKQEDAKSFLLSLPGVGLKSAKCIMMYSLNFDVLPVDIHVARISKRLGLVADLCTNKTHEILEQIIPQKLRYSFHVFCIQHGRAICRGKYPKCEKCCLAELCPKIGVYKHLVGNNPGGII